MIRVVVAGAAGRMGSETCAAILQDSDVELVGVIDRPQNVAGLQATYNGHKVAVASSSNEAITDTKPQVLVDFTHAAAVADNAEVCGEHGVHMVIGTTGLGEADVERLKVVTLRSGINILLVPNFALGAVLMMRFAQEAARFAERAEIIELHHDAKKDAPSGTALLTAEKITETLHAAELPVEERLSCARGASLGAVRIHSVRLSGLVAHQEVIFGLPGQTLTIRHDSLDRRSFMPGVLLAVKKIGSQPGFTYGLEELLF